MRLGFAVVVLAGLLVTGCGGGSAPATGPDTPVDSSMTPPPAAAGDTGAVAGTVTTGDGVPLPGAHLEPRAVDVPGGADLPEEVVATGGTGEYRWSGLSPGRYEFRVRFESRLLGVPLEAVVEAGRTTTLDFVVTL